MTLLSAHLISKSFAAKQLFKNISFAIEEGQKIGLVGPNGAGKSTLLTLLAKMDQPDSGKITFSNSLRLSFLKQKTELHNAINIYEHLMSASDDPYDGQNIAQCFELITKMKLDSLPQKEETLINQLSGGWQKRVALAFELMKKPNLILLDEPTNHLDIDSILWLENFIKKQNQVSFLTITHDRAFLQNTSDAIFDLDPRNPDGLIKSYGNYVQYLETKSMLLDGQKKLEEKKRNTMLIEKDWLARGPQARLTKQKARINRANDLISEVDSLENKNQLRKVEFDFGKNENTPKKLIELSDVSFSYDSSKLFSNLSAMIRPGARIGLLGKNGCGKSTLIKVLLNQILPTEGKAFLNPDIQVCHFEQGKETLNIQTTVLKVICPEGDYVHLHGTPVFARSYLSRFYFNPQQMDMPVSQLSGGEQSRLLIAKLMLNPAHVLILDEPTNDLDVETLDVLTDCLKDYSGALILVSHDRYFLDQNTNEIWAFTENQNGQIIKFADYLQWQDWHDQLEVESPASKNSVNKKNDPSTNKNKKLSFKEQLEYDSIENTIADKEKTLTTKQTELNHVDTQSNYEKLATLGQEIQNLENEIQKLYSRWQELEGKQK